MSTSGTSTPGWVGSAWERVVVGVSKDASSKDAIRWAVANKIKNPDDMLILLHVVTKVPTHQKVEMYQSDVNNTTFVHYVRTVVQPLMLELKDLVDPQIKLELKVGRNNSKEKGIMDESRKLKATSLVVGTTSRGIFGIRGRGGVGGHCMRNRPPHLSVYVILKDRLTACKEADVAAPSSTTAATTPGRGSPASCSASSSPGPQRQMLPRHSSGDSPPRYSSAGVQTGSGSPFEVAASYLSSEHGANSELHHGAHSSHTAPQPHRAGTWPSDQAGATAPGGGSPGFQAYHPGSAMPAHTMAGVSVSHYALEGGVESIMHMQQLQLHNQQQMQYMLQQRQEQQMQSILHQQAQQAVQQQQLQQLQQRLQRDYLAEVDAWRRANCDATAEQQQAFMADLEARMAHATAALAGLPLAPAGSGAAAGVAANGRSTTGDAYDEASDDSPESLRAAAALAAQRGTETAARIEQMAQEAARARAAAEGARRAAEEEAQRREGVRQGGGMHGGEEEGGRREEGVEGDWGKGGAAAAGGAGEGGEGVGPVVRRVHHYREYSFEEIVAATDNFNPERKLGEGGFGTVYSGTLHHTPVAVKLLKSKDSFQAMAEFQQEVEILSQIQHPHVLMLLGCCPTRYVLVYEFLANGSLEDRLLCLHSSPPLPWFVRIRVAAEIASALLILHTRPMPIVHRDLKPGNILLDKNFVAKLGDVGLAKLMPGLNGDGGGDGSFMRESTPVGTFAYVDPEFQRTGEFGPKSDVYAFGIVLLDLLTGRTPALYEALEIAVENGREDVLMGFLDGRAGTWPAGMPMDIARLAIRCSEMKRRNRPDLETEVMPVLDRMRSVAVKAEDDAKRAPLLRPVAAAPPCLFCPITQEMMVNPVIAADGHTYELVAIQQWLEKSDRSPMTNVRLPSKDLVPNRALRSMILDWRDQHGP